MQILANLGHRGEKIKTTNLNKHDYTVGARWTHLEQMSSIWPHLWYQSGNVSGMLLTVSGGEAGATALCADVNHSTLGSPLHVVSNCDFSKQKERSSSTSRARFPMAWWVSCGWLNWYLPEGSPSHFSKKVQIEWILTEQKGFLFAGKSIIIPRCGDLYFHFLLHYWFIRNIVAFKITTFVCGYLFEMMSKYCIMFYVHYLLVVGWSPFNVLCMYSCQVTFTQIWKTKKLCFLKL